MLKSTSWAHFLLSRSTYAKTASGLSPCEEPVDVNTFSATFEPFLAGNVAEKVQEETIPKQGHN
jgi:hypothetical protein